MGINEPPRLRQWTPVPLDPRAQERHPAGVGSDPGFLPPQARLLDAKTGSNGKRRQRKAYSILATRQTEQKNIQYKPFCVPFFPVLVSMTHLVLVFSTFCQKYVMFGTEITSLDSRNRAKRHSFPNENM